MFQQLSLLNPRCRNLTSAWIKYRIKGRQKWLREDCDITNTFYMLSSPSDGTYEIYMTIQNNEGISSSSNTIYIDISSVYT